MKQLQFQAQVRKVETMADGGLGIKMHTQDISNEDKAQVLGFGENLAWVVMAEMPVDKVELPPEPVADIEGAKSPAKWLRGILFRYWESIGKPLAGFEIFYHSEIEKVGNAYKSKLPPR